jgi:hypothetical protein
MQATVDVIIEFRLTFRLGGIRSQGSLAHPEIFRMKRYPHHSRVDHFGSKPSISRVGLAKARAIWQKLQEHKGTSMKLSASLRVSTAIAAIFASYPAAAQEHFARHKLEAVSGSQGHGVVDQYSAICLSLHR